VPLATGTRLGSYAIRAPLGRGGVGEVYRAWDPRLEREVALKILHERPEVDPDRVWRFVAEARAASALNHPNILTVFDAAVDGDTPYIVSELIEGDSLRGEVRRGPVPLKRLLDLATQIADGLAEAHAAGIVHRDLKPENIMVTPAGRAKILDFGLARSAGLQAGAGIPSEPVDQTQTESGLLVGTIPYMSPEQARGSATDFRSDQFSFGLILYEMAAGRPAFRRETPAQTLDAILNEEPEPLSDVSPQVPIFLWWIIERCLAKNPTERYGATADLHRDLRNLRDRLADALAKERRLPAAGAGRSRLWRLAIPLAAVVAAAGVVLLYGAAAAPAHPFDESQLRYVPFATEAGYEGLPAWSPDGQTIAYAADVNGVLQIFTRTLSSADAAQVTYGSYDCKYPFWSPDGKRLYYISLARTRDGIWSVGAAGGSPQVVLEDAIRGALSPDGRTLVFLRDEARAEIVGRTALYVASPGGPEPWAPEEIAAAAKRYEGFGSERFIEGALAFSPDGSKLALVAVPIRTFPYSLNDGSRGWRLWVIDWPHAGTPVRRLTAWEDAVPHISSFAWLPDSRHVIMGVAVMYTPGSHLWIADTRDDRVWPLTHGADSESHPSVSRDGNRAVFTKGEPDYDLVELSLADGTMRSVVGTARKESDPAVSLDGSLLAYITDRRGRDEIWLRSRAGQPFDRPLITQNDFVDAQNIMLGGVSFSPNGQRIAYLRTGGRPIIPLQIYTSAVAGSPPVRLLPDAHQSYQLPPTWSPDGQWVAFAEWRGERWDLAKVRFGSGELPVVLRSDGVPNAQPNWSPKGDWITWETDDGIVLVSPDGKQEKRLSEAAQWLVHDWSPDGAAIIGIGETENRHLVLLSLDVSSGRQRVVADLGPSPPVNNPVQGFSVSPDGRSVLASFVRMRGDLWLLEGLQQPQSVWRRLWNRASP
jgi:Tol biopolymer transport system component